MTAAKIPKRARKATSKRSRKRTRSRKKPAAKKATPEETKPKPFDAIAAALDAMTVNDLMAIGAVGYDAVTPRKQ